MSIGDLNDLFLISIVAVLAPILVDIPRRVRIPVVVVELAGGILIGPYGLDWATENPLVVFLASFGLAMLFFMAGLELDFVRVRGRPLTLGVAGWLLSLGLAIGIAAVLQAAGFIVSAKFVGVALSTTAIGTLLPGAARPRRAGDAVRHAGDGRRGGRRVRPDRDDLAALRQLRRPGRDDGAARRVHADRARRRAAGAAGAAAAAGAAGRGDDGGQRPAGRARRDPDPDRARLPGQRVRPGRDPRRVRVGHRRRRDGPRAGGARVPGEDGRRRLRPARSRSSSSPAAWASTSARCSPTPRSTCGCRCSWRCSWSSAASRRSSTRSSRLRDKLGLAFYSATCLPLVVAITEIGVRTGNMHDYTATALVGAAMVSVLTFPLLAKAVRPAAA